MYEAYFGLRERPFSIAPDPRYLYLSARHREALAHLLYGVRERGGFVQLTGEVGTGKTTVVRALLEQLPEHVDVALVLNPKVTVREFLSVICAELDIEAPRREYSTQALIDALNRYLLQSYAQGRHTLVLIDEAQCLSEQVLEQVRLLTNLETDREKLLQIVLVGQPELRAMLARREMRQVAQRITTRYHLAPLTLRETHEYIRHRLRVAGCTRALFSGAAVLAVHRLGAGTPRLINVICDRALLGAYARSRPRVGTGTVVHAAAEVAGRPKRRRLALAGLAAGLAAGALTAIGVWQSQGIPAPAPIDDAVAEQVEHPTLTQRLGDDTLRSDAEHGFGRLFQAWGVSFAPNSGKTPCEQAAASGLRCHYERTDLELLVQRGLPTLLELEDAVGRLHSAVLSGRRGGELTLAFGDQELHIPFHEASAAYSGSAVTLWRPPALVERLMSKGSGGPSVRWLSERLARLDGGSADLARYDAVLEQRVRDFQRRYGLLEDGIAGETTLFELLARAPDPGTPRLSE